MLPIILLSKIRPFTSTFDLASLSLIYDNLQKISFNLEKQLREAFFLSSYGSIRICSTYRGVKFTQSSS